MSAAADPDEQKIDIFAGEEESSGTCQADEMCEQSEPNSLHDIILDAWDCAFADTKVVYLSGPITTGLLYVKMARMGDIDKKSKKEIFNENCASLVLTAKRLRKERFDIIVEPASLNVGSWDQKDYLQLWERFIERRANLLIFMPDWEYSAGCAKEFARAVTHDIRTESVSGAPITINDGIALLTAAHADLRSNDAKGQLTNLAGDLASVIGRLKKLARPLARIDEPLRKDASLDYLAELGFNVAQFVSFSPQEGRACQEYARVAGHSPNAPFPNLEAAVGALLSTSPDKSVNVRSYEPFNPQSREFVYGIKDPVEAIRAVERLSAQSLYTIVNETVDIHDGGVSGVLMGNVLEFAPDATPRCVEKPGTASLPRGWGRDLLATVYRFPVELAVQLASRLEFSIHPQPRGWKQTNVLVWEYEEQPYVDAAPQLIWPNNFSRIIGDKVFGLLVAHHIGLPVPLTLVVGRRVAPFSFGRSTGWGETWIRTSPIEQVPGRFPTYRGWVDPYSLMRLDDGEEPTIAAILSQEGVRPHYSGALIVGASGEIILEGKSGEGESFMQGQSAPEAIPDEVRADVRAIFESAQSALGPVRLEWVHDGERAWVLQMHRGATETDSTRITQGEATNWIDFDVGLGLEALRKQIVEIPSGFGLILKGKVGLTSHIADVIRKAKIPARMENAS